MRLMALSGYNTFPTPIKLACDTTIIDRPAVGHQSLFLCVWPEPCVRVTSINLANKEYGDVGQAHWYAFGILLF